MANNVGNKLTIKCQNPDIMERIKKMIIRNDKNKNKEFTMEILLPRSMVFADEETYDFNWNYAVWGTKTDVYDYSIVESGDSITFYYITTWKPNRDWVKVLCDYIDHVVGYEWERKIKNLSVEHRYSDYSGDFGGIVQWKPREKFQYKHYDSYHEYLKIHDKKAYKRITVAEAKMKAGNNSIMTRNIPI